MQIENLRDFGLRNSTGKARYSPTCIASSISAVRSTTRCPSSVRPSWSSRPVTVARRQAWTVVLATEGDCTSSACSVRHGRYVSENLPSSSGIASLPRSRWVRCNISGEQAEIDEIAIQTAPCGNGRQVLWCIHGFFKLAVCVPIIECSGIRRHQQWVEMNILLNVYNITAVLCG